MDVAWCCTSGTGALYLVPDRCTTLHDVPQHHARPLARAYGMVPGLKHIAERTFGLFLGDDWISGKNRVLVQKFACSQIDKTVDIALPI